MAETGSPIARETKPPRRPPGAGFVLVAGLFLASAPALAQEPKGDPQAGQLVFNNACRTCHTLNAGDNRLGPNLHAVVGRKAGAAEGFAYSSALKDAGLTWDRATLDRFITAPDAVVPGHNMKPYTGMTSAEDRANLLAFLESRR